MDKIVMRLAVSLALAGGFCTAGAQPLADPTRPPPIPQTAAPGALGAQGGLGAAVGRTSSGPTLQSVLISRKSGGRQVAVIDGEPVALGGTFHGAILVRVAANEVELRRGNQRQILKLYAPGTPGSIKAAAPAKQR